MMKSHPAHPELRLSQSERNAEKMPCSRIRFYQVHLCSVIYPKYITAEMILSYVRALENTTGSNVQTLYNIIGGKAQALEFNIRSQSDAIGVELADLKLKKNVLLCCISRHGKILIPGGRDSVQLGDTVVVVTTNKGMNDFKDILA